MTNKKVLFRASGVSALLSDPRSKADREAGIMGSTAKSFVKKTFLHLNYGYDMPVITDAMTKGKLLEQDAMDLLSRIIPIDEFRAKNEKWYTDEYFCGTPDICLELSGYVEDVKCSWDISTFMSVGEDGLDKSYYAQGQVYMHLTGLHKYRLCYALLDTPKSIVYDMCKRLQWKFGGPDVALENPEYLRYEEKLEACHTVSHIPEEKRLKVYTFDYDPNFMQDLIERAKRAREYYDTLFL